MLPIRLLLALALSIVLAASVHAVVTPPPPDALISKGEVIVSGYVTDSDENPVPDISVFAYCHPGIQNESDISFSLSDPFSYPQEVNTLGKDVTISDAGYEGAYTIYDSDTTCYIGDLAWIVFSHDGVTHVGGPVALSAGQVSDAPSYIPLANINAVGVPEFTTIGLGLAVAIVGAGLVYMRRH